MMMHVCSCVILLCNSFDETAMTTDESPLMSSTTSTPTLSIDRLKPVSTVSRVDREKWRESPNLVLFKVSCCFPYG